MERVTRREPESLFGEPKAVMFPTGHTAAALKSAVTGAQLHKLTGILIRVSSALNNTEYEINQAIASALVQDWPC